MTSLSGSQVTVQLWDAKLLVVNKVDEWRTVKERQSYQRVIWDSSPSVSPQILKP